jgi:hypothetical protein
MGILELLSSPLYQFNAAMQPPDPTPDPLEPSAEVESAFAETDALIDQLKQQYAQVQANRQRLAQANPEREESNLIKAKLEELELNLAFTILSSLGDAAREQLEVLGRQESFWQFVRFAGLGFILGLVIKGITG